MNNYSLIDCINYPEKSWSVQFADHSLLPFRVACNAQNVTINDEGEKNESEIKTQQIGLRIIAALAVIFTLPVTLIALTIKWWKREEWQGVKVDGNDLSKIDAVQIEGEDDLIENDIFEEDAPVFPEDCKEFIQHLENELAVAQPLDQPLGSPLPGSWRKYGKTWGELNQTFSSFIEAYEARKWPARNPLHIQCIGAFTKTDLNIISITSDYLNIFHHLPIQLSSTIMKMDQLKEVYLDSMKKKPEASKAWYEFWEKRLDSSFPRENGQYDGEAVLEIIRNNLLPTLKSDEDQNPQMIAFTSEDLFTQSMKNFVFGCASLVNGTGVWSKARFGNPEESPKDFQKCLLRMMKISAHEFGHMQGLAHCTDYDCNIGGYMSLNELDSRPLIYCLQDTAKICYLTHTSLLEHHQRILGFFQNFNEKYKLNCDFSKEISILKQRISVLKG